MHHRGKLAPVRPDPRHGAVPRDPTERDRAALLVDIGALERIEHDDARVTKRPPEPCAQRLIAGHAELDDDSGDRVTSADVHGESHGGGDQDDLVRMHDGHVETGVEQPLDRPRDQHAAQRSSRDRRPGVRAPGKTRGTAPATEHTRDHHGAGRERDRGIAPDLDPGARHVGGSHRGTLVRSLEPPIGVREQQLHHRAPVHERRLRYQVTQPPRRAGEREEPRDPPVPGAPDEQRRGQEGDGDEPVDHLAGILAAAQASRPGGNPRFGPGIAPVRRARGGSSFAA